MYIIGRSCTWPWPATGRSWVLCSPRTSTPRAAQHRVIGPLGDVDLRPLQVGERQRSIRGPRREIADLFLDLREPQAIGIANHRNDESLRGANRDAAREPALPQHP